MVHRRPRTSIASANDMNVVISRNQDAADTSSFEDALAGLLAQLAPVLIVPHVYHVPEDAAMWAELAAIDEPLLALSWLHPRSAEWLLKRHGVGRAGLVTIHMGAFDSPEACFDECRPHLAGASGPGETAERGSAAPARWYPVIDGARCVNCKQCLRFCLFGVYEFDAQFRVTVANPDNCKPGCPACARICPNSAIMFPLYDKDDAIAGAPGKFVTPDDAAREMFEKRTRQTYQGTAAADDDLDELIDDLDRLADGGRD